MRPISLVMLFLSVALLAALPLTAAHITHTASTTDDLTGLAMVSSNNGWAVGKTGTSLHYDGSSWSLIPSGTTADLFGVSFGPPSAPSADSGFAVGGSGGTAVALYRSGVSWTPAMAGLTGPDAKQLSSVSALSPSDAWAVDAVSGAFWHWSGVAGLGGGWGEVTATGFGLNSIFMTSSFDGWAVGAGGRIYHYTGGGWNLFTTAGFSLNSVFMVNQNEGWAVGDNGAIFHYSSGTWTGPVSPGSTNQNLRSVFMISETEGWAVGDAGTLMHYLNGFWTPVTNMSGISQNLNAVSFSGGIGFAVGGAGVIVLLSAQSPQGVLGATLKSVYLSSSGDGWIVGCSTGGCGTSSGEPSILHWIGNSYVRGTSLAQTSDLNSVFMVNPSEGWAVGGVGTSSIILHYTGGAWSQVTAPPSNAILRSVFMLDSGDGWAVGDSGVILRSSGGSWGAVSTPTSNSLRSVFMDSPVDGWAVGDGGTILRYQGSQWQSYSSPTVARLNSVILVDSSHGWAAGAGGTILHYDGLIWSVVPTGVSANLNSIAQAGAQEAWAVGDFAMILHWNGISWYQSTPSPPLSGSPNLNSIFIASNGFGLIVGAPAAPGSQGTILQLSTSSPVPELPNPQFLLIASSAVALLLISIRRRMVGKQIPR